MAKRKKHHSKRTHRRRRMGGIGGGSIAQDAITTLGFIAGHIGGGMMQKHMTSLNPKITSGLQLVGGFMLKRRAHGHFMEGLSFGLIGAGAMGLSQEFHVISGIDNMINGVDGEMQGGEQRLLTEGEMQGLANEHIMRGMANEPNLGRISYVG